MYTFLPEAFIISATEYPNKLLRTCPKCSGLLVFGDEYSTITACASAVGETKPKLVFAYAVLKKRVYTAASITKFKKPLTTL